MSVRWVGRVLLVPVWLVVLGLLGLVAARLVAFDDRRIFMVADAFTLWVYLPAYAIVVAALCFRFRALAAAAAVVVVAQLAWVVPPHGMAGTISTVSLASYPQHAESIQNGASGFAILSRLPLSHVRIAGPNGQPAITATMTFQRRAVYLVGVHPSAPVDSFARTQRQQRAITAIVRRTARPRVVAGDFNSTMDNEWMGELTDLGLREAQQAVGRSFATTWPNGERLLPPIRIDHALVDPPLVPQRAAEGRGQGSDHRPIIVDLAILQGSPSADR